MIDDKEILLATIARAIHDSGWNVLFLNNEHPFKINIYNELESINLKIIIYNITYGGYPRSREEYRIQIKIRKIPITDESNFRTLILGYWDEMEVFAGFDLNKHRTPKWSSSLQVKKDYLEKAYQNGFSIYDKGNNEIVVAFRPDFFIEYVKNLGQLHNFGQYEKDIKILNKVAGELEINDSLINEVSLRRRTTVIQVTKRLRESNFNLRVLTAYGFKCSMCGIQLKLIDAAHILPVGVEGSNDATYNGVALCALHHRAYDRALVTFDEKYRITKSKNRMKYLESIRQDSGIAKFISDLKPNLLLPPDKNDRPHIDFVKQANEFRGW